MGRGGRVNGLGTPLRNSPGSRFLPSHAVIAILFFDDHYSQNVLIFQWLMPVCVCVCVSSPFFALAQAYLKVSDQFLANQGQTDFILSQNKLKVCVP